MCTLIEYSDIYLRPSGHLRQYYWNKSVLNNANDIVDFSDNNIYDDNS